MWYALREVLDDTINDTSRNDAAERDQARHTLSAEETSVMFAAAGVPAPSEPCNGIAKIWHPGACPSCAFMAPRERLLETPSGCACAAGDSGSDLTWAPAGIT